MVNLKKEYLSETKKKFYDELKSYSLNLKASKEIEGFPANSIIGEKNYPNLKIHSISNENLESVYKNNSNLVKLNYDKIIKIKARNIFGSSNNINVKDLNFRIKEELADIYKAKNMINFVSKFDKEIKFNCFANSKDFGILGSKNELLSIETIGNVSVSKNIEKYTNDDIKSKKAIIDLYEKSYNEHQIINLLSLGEFGHSLNKKLMPTKWAISAFDKTIEKHLYLKLIKNKLLEKFEIFSYFDKGNFFLIILIPDYFQAQIIETWSNIVESDYVSFDNKLDYLDIKTAGAFYATKLGVFENLCFRKKQSAFISLRVIKDYEIPLGLVFVRECIRETMKNKIFESSDLEEIKNFLLEKFPKYYNLIIDSKLFLNIFKQKKLNLYF